PQEALDRAGSIPTQAFAPPWADEPESDPHGLSLPSVPLVQQLDGRRIRATPAAVALRVLLQPRQKLYELASVPVQFLCPADFRLRPLFSDERAGRIRMRLLGPAGEEPPVVIAF